jgi:pentatricopeptide repeat protein
MQKQGVDMDAEFYYSLILSYGRLQKYDRCTQCFDEMQQKFGASYTGYSRILTAFAKRNISEPSITYFKEMITLGFEPDMKIHTCLISCLGESGNIETMLRWHKNMIPKG